MEWSDFNVPLSWICNERFERKNMKPQKSLSIDNLHRCITSNVYLKDLREHGNVKHYTKKAEIEFIYLNPLLSDMLNCLPCWDIAPIGLKYEVGGNQFNYWPPKSLVEWSMLRFSLCKLLIKTSLKHMPLHPLYEILRYKNTMHLTFWSFDYTC